VLRPADLSMPWHNREAYALALEVGDYMAAAREAAAALRRVGGPSIDGELWRMRLAGCLRALRTERRGR